MKLVVCSEKAQFVAKGFSHVVGFLQCNRDSSVVIFCNSRKQSKPFSIHPDNKLDQAKLPINVLNINSLTAMRFLWEQKLPPHMSPTIGIVQKVLSTTNTTIHKHHHHGRAVRPSYGVGLIDPPNLMQVTSSKGICRRHCCRFLYKSIN
jgi:hypothetical protein